MVEGLSQLREFNSISVVLRLSLALICSGVIGMERARKHRSAGFRTYMLVCLGSTLAMLLGQYECYILNQEWGYAGKGLLDVSRFGAQVINGIGFIATGTILVTEHQEVKGLTTSAALWASACMGLAIGAGFYECVFVGMVLIFLCVHLLPALEGRVTECSRYMNLYIGFQSMEDVRVIVNCMKGMNLQICEIDIDRRNKEAEGKFHAVFSVRLLNRQSHSQILAALYEMDSVCMINVI